MTESSEMAATDARVQIDGEDNVAFTTVTLEDDTDGRSAPKSPAAQTQSVQLDFNLDESKSNSLAPADSITTTHPGGAVKLRLDANGPGALTPISIPTAFKNTVMKIPHVVAMAVKRNKQWQRWTYQQYYNDSVRVAKSLIRLGMEPNKGVGILGLNCPEWFISFMGSIYAGGIATGIYTTNTPEAVHHVLSDSQSEIVIVENDLQLQKILKIRGDLPNLRAVVQYEGALKEKYDSVYTWDEFLCIGDQVADAVVQGRVSGISPNKCCSLIYTSGTTGTPKGVMVSHDNYTFMARSIGPELSFEFGREILISFLPLSHTAAQFIDLVCGFVHGISVFFAGPDALKGGLLNTMKEVRPTIFGGVPRVWEKIMEGMQEAGKKSSATKKKIGVWVKQTGLKGAYAKIQGQPLPSGWKIANKLGFKKVRLAMGLDRCKLLVSGAAPISKHVMEYFMSLDLIIYEIFGMSETSGPSTACKEGSVRLKSVGRALTGTGVRIDSPDEDGAGEIEMTGRNMMMGYLGREEQTADTFTHDGWIKSGDIGTVDKDGFLYITGRRKEILITAGGENIPPVLIEDLLKAELPIVGNCMLVGDRRKFLTMLISLKVVIDPDTMAPKDELTPGALDWCRENRSMSKTVTDVISRRDDVVLRAIQNAINIVNKQATSNAQKVQKWSVVPCDFSLPGGELGPTLKLKRPVVLDKYQKTVFAFYGEDVY